jgi:flagellar biosynthesis/type III secretory pathway protein FliH
MKDSPEQQLKQQLKASNDLYARAFKAGHDAGYHLGYKEGIAKATQLIEQAFANLPKPQAG